MIKLTAASGLQELKNAFAENRERAIHDVYRLHRDTFLKYCQSWSADTDNNIDCFQEAVIALYENLIRGKIKTDQSSLKTYLFAIGKHKVMNELEKRKRREKRDEVQNEYMFEESTESNETKQLNLEKTIDQLGATCKDLLVKFYYHQYSIEAIMIDMKYKNPNTVKAHKSRCMKKLRELMVKTSTR